MATLDDLQSLRGLITGEFIIASCLQGHLVACYGNEAAGWSWIFISGGIFCLGWFIAEQIFRPKLKWLFWLAAAILFAVGFRLLMESA